MLVRQATVGPQSSYYTFPQMSPHSPLETLIKPCNWTGVASISKSNQISLEALLRPLKATIASVPDALCIGRLCIVATKTNCSRYILCTCHQAHRSMLFPETNTFCAISRKTPHYLISHCFGFKSRATQLSSCFRTWTTFIHCIRYSS